MPLGNRFVSDFASWAREAGYPDAVLRRLPQLLRKLPGQLSELDAQQSLFVRTLPNEDSLVIRVEAATNGVYSSGKTIVFWAVGPYWEIKNPSPNSDVSDLVKGFLFLAAQHAMRSRILSSTAAVALTFDSLFDFRHADIQRLVFGPGSLTTSLDEALAHIRESLPPDGRSGSSRKARTVGGWMRRLNTMDPFVQRGVFQYWRARALWNADFGEDAVTALDGLSSVAGEALNCWTTIRVDSRAQLASQLDLTGVDSDALSGLYELRCAFGAHPAASKWWDFGEIYGEAVEAYFETAVRLLGALSDLETQHRSVQPNPELWSSWFEDNACALLDAVWFARLP